MPVFVQYDDVITVLPWEDGIFSWDVPSYELEKHDTSVIIGGDKYDTNSFAGIITIQNLNTFYLVTCRHHIVLIDWAECGLAANEVEHWHAHGIEVLELGLSQNSGGWARHHTLSDPWGTHFYTVRRDWDSFRAAELCKTGFYLSV